MSGKVAVIEPDELVMVSVMSVNVTLTSVSVIGGGHSKSEGIVTSLVLTLTLPLPDLVLKVVVPETGSVTVCSPEGSWSFDPLLMQPTVAVAVASRVAVAVVPAPQTSPVTVKNAEPFGPVVFVADRSSDVP